MMHGQKNIKLREISTTMNNAGKWVSKTITQCHSGRKRQIGGNRISRIGVRNRL